MLFRSQWSVEDAEKFEQNAVVNGVSIVEISDEDREELKRKSQLTYHKTKYWFSTDLVKNIRQRLH